MFRSTTFIVRLSSTTDLRSDDGAQSPRRTSSEAPADADGMVSCSTRSLSLSKNFDDTCL